jgi:hypothetical protein
MDKLIRTYVKDILHLPHCIPNGLIYCKKRDGGLAIPKLAVSSTLKEGLMLINTTDSPVSNLGDKFKAIAKTPRINWNDLNLE